MTQGPDVNELSSILAPLFSTFSFPQLETVLYAYLPTRLESYIHKTGIYAVDHFIVTATVTIVLVITKLIVKAVQPFLQPNTRKKHVKKQDISVLIEPVHQDDYHSSKIFIETIGFHLIITYC
jgi:hypothetical protein